MNMCYYEFFIDDEVRNQLLKTYIEFSVIYCRFG